MFGQIDQQRRNLARFEKIDKPHDHRLRLPGRVALREVADRIDDDRGRLHALDELVDRHEMHFEAMHCRARGVKVQQAIVDPATEVEADGSHVADELRFRLFEREVQTPFAASAGRIHEMGSDGCFSRAGGAR